MLLSKYKLPILIVIGVLVAGAIGFAISYSLVRNTKSVQVDTAISKQSTQGTKTQPHKVALIKDQKQPIDLIVNLGDYVQFNSKDGSEHQIIQGSSTAEHGHGLGLDAKLEDSKGGQSHGVTTAPLDSGVFKADEGYLVQFKNVGKFEFHDNYNHDYTITVIVYDMNKKP